MGEARARGVHAPEVLISLDPTTGESVGEYPVCGLEEVRGAVTLARASAGWWVGLGLAGRREILMAWKGELARGIDELAALIRREMGKPLDDARLEVVAGINNIGWAATNAGRVLRPRRVRTPLVAINQRAWIEYEPLGIVGVIGPWNFPVSTPMGLIASALAAGNAVVFKPSEVTPGVGRWLEEAFRAVVPEEKTILRTVTGYGETGAALVVSGVDKIAFTGSARTGRRIMAAAAENLTPLVLELGGKDPMIVAEDADLGAAAEAAVWGGFQNAGQGCISVERVFVVDAVYDEFLARVSELASDVKAGGDAGADVGPIATPAQLDLISLHLRDALERGAQALGGGVRPPYVDPAVLTDVPEDALVMREETFGPTLPIARVRDANEAVLRANASPYALGSSVFSKRRGVEISRRLRAGMVSISSLISFSLVPGLPFGGSGESGFGRKHGDEGLKEFARAKAITRQRFSLPVTMQSFRRPGGAVDRIVRITQFVHGRRWGGPGQVPTSGQAIRKERPNDEHG